MNNTETDRHKLRQTGMKGDRQACSRMWPYMFQVFVDVGVVQVELGVAHLSQDCISLDASANQTIER